MKNIPLSDAFALIEFASAVIVDGVVTYANLDNLTGELDNQFLYVGWEDAGREFGIKFTEGNNQFVTVDGTTMYLIDLEGDAIRLQLLQQMCLDE